MISKTRLIAPARTLLGRSKIDTLDVSIPRFSALLIGECPNENIVPVDLWEATPAFLPLIGSGKWLNQQLNHPALHDWKFTLENAVTLHRVAHRLHTFDAIIALSRMVGEIYELPYVPHPAYWQRWQSHVSEHWVYLLSKELRRHHV